MQDFSNRDPHVVCVNPLRLRRDRPHVYMHGGLWRVSPMPMHVLPSRETRGHWAAAHRLVISLNRPLLDARFGRAAAPNRRRPACDHCGGAGCVPVPGTSVWLACPVCSATCDSIRGAT